MSSSAAAGLPENRCLRALHVFELFFREFDLEYDSKIFVNLVKTHPMPQYQICTIPGCSSRSDRRECEGVKLHRLPQDPDQRYR